MYAFWACYEYTLRTDNLVSFCLDLWFLSEKQITYTFFVAMIGCFQHSLENFMCEEFEWYYVF